jgi:hypothetical protein
VNILRQIASLFVGGGSGPGDAGLYYFVKCNRCGEVIQVRINSMNDLSAADDGSGLFTRKTIVGRRCYNRIEAEFSYRRNPGGGYNSTPELVNAEINGGTLVDKAAFQAYQAEQAASPKS